jgi:Asp-tRNA(Asn)/Glu-tRNA(Gln) amidotransferase A subunit family amidase
MAKRPIGAERDAILRTMPADPDTSKKVRSAYEAALERMESAGIEAPREQAYPPETLRAMAEARTRAEAKLAELEIFFRKKQAETLDPSDRAGAEKEYLAERERIQVRRDREIETLRDGAQAAP